MAKKFKFNFGEKVSDAITGFVGTITARVEYMNGCLQYEVTPCELKDGVPQKEPWLDEQRLGKVKKPVEEPKTQVVRHIFSGRRGGPGNHPAAHKPQSSIDYTED